MSEVKRHPLTGRPIITGPETQRLYNRERYIRIKEDPDSFKHHRALNNGYYHKHAEEINRKKREAYKNQKSLSMLKKLGGSLNIVGCSVMFKFDDSAKQDEWVSFVRNHLLEDHSKEYALRVRERDNNKEDVCPPGIKVSWDGFGIEQDE